MRSKGDRYRRLQAWVDGAQSNAHLCALIEAHYAEICTSTNDAMIEVFHYTFLRMSAREVNEHTFLNDWRRLFIATKKEIEKLSLIDNANISSYADIKEAKKDEY